MIDLLLDIFGVLNQKLELVLPSWLYFGGYGLATYRLIQEESVTSALHCSSFSIFKDKGRGIHSGYVSQKGIQDKPRMAPVARRRDSLQSIFRHPEKHSALPPLWERYWFFALLMCVQIQSKKLYLKSMCNNHNILDTTYLSKNGF